MRYTWKLPNPYFLPSLARASPFYLYRPAHYLKQFHAAYRDPQELAALVEEQGQRNWVALLLKRGRQYRNDNPDLPTLQPWMLKTRPPADRFIFSRNPYYHRIDTNGRQLPYADEVAITIASAKLIPAKTGAGETDLQARSLSFSDYTFLKQGEKRNDFTVHLWRTAKGAHVALYPNLNTSDPEWQKLFRNTDFRRALSIATNRHEINQVIYFGLAYEGNNCPLPQSPLFNNEYSKRWTEFDIYAANRILDKLGLIEYDSRGIRLLPDGRPMEIIVETAGEDSEQSDVLELVHDSWMQVGIKIYTKPLQRQVLRNRVFAGTTLMSVWFGMENGIPTANTSPAELAPTNQEQFQWPKWGQYYQTNGNAGEQIDMAVPRRLASLNQSWEGAEDDERRRRIWGEMLDLYTDGVFSIGLVSGVRQPVVVSNNLRNVPSEGIYNWDPGAHFGIYQPDTFWFDEKPKTFTSGN
jgi:peptide/nickel transport system substrate-binding protein